MLAGANRRPSPLGASNMDKVDTGLDKHAGQKSTPAPAVSGSGGLDALFELLAYYTLVLAMAVVAAFVVLRGADELSISLDSTGKTAVAIVTALATLVGLNWHLERPQGQTSQLKLQQTAKRWAYPLTLIAGLALGWQWREHGDPDHDRKQAIQTAAATCVQFPTCLQLAQRSAGGADIAQYFKPKPNGGTR